MLERIRQKMARRRGRAEQAYWAKMTDERAAEIDSALIYEGSAVEGRKFMETYQAKKAAGFTGTMSLTWYDFFFDKIVPGTLAVMFVAGIVWFVSTHPIH